MFNKLCIFVGKHPILYFILNLTWGLPLTIIGLIITLLFWPFSTRRKFFYIYYIELKSRATWGFEMGTTFVCGKSSGLTLKKHEFGHTCQNAVLGPFMIFVISIPSAVRFWYREHLKKKGIDLKTGYYDIWFESSANEIGASVINE